MFIKIGKIYVVDKYATDNLILSQNYKMLMQQTSIKMRHFVYHIYWATHGIKSDVNSHPHLDNTRTFLLFMAVLKTIN